MTRTAILAASYVAVIALASGSDAWRLIGAAMVLVGGIVLAMHSPIVNVERPTCIATLEGTHVWGPWSQPYDAWVNGPAGPHEQWQTRSCQCGNRDFRPAKALVP